MARPAVRWPSYFSLSPLWTGVDEHTMRCPDGLCRFFLEGGEKQRWPLADVGRHETSSRCQKVSSLEKQHAPEITGLLELLTLAHSEKVVSAPPRMSTAVVLSPL